MKPVAFKEQNTVFAENQPEYIPLPAYRDEIGEVISCWELTWKERLYLFYTGRLWVRILTFNKPLQPMVLQTDCPFLRRVNRYLWLRHTQV